MPTRIVLSLALLCLACCGGAQPSHPGALVDPGESEVFVLETANATIHTLVAGADGFGTATHIIEGPSSLVIVDTHLLRRYAIALRRYADELGKPIERVIVTHGHPDHYFGLEYFEDVPTYGTESCIHNIRRRHRAHISGHHERVGDEVADYVRIPQHELPVADVVIDSIRYELTEVPNAEDMYQLVIRLPDEGVMIVQDFVFNGYHGFLGGRRFERWSDVLDRMAAEPGYDHILIGHGAPGDQSLMTEMAAYLREAAAIYEAAETGAEFVDEMTARWPEREGRFVLEVGLQFMFDEE